ncbi:hypothetical protein ABW19_dt0207282 [Dactylella cylindrospora]|nr:hypothetical protein ABW19_dt0207282 [Dactylella cylindrospora]
MATAEFFFAVSLRKKFQKVAEVYESKKSFSSGYLRYFWEGKRLVMDQSLAENGVTEEDLDEGGKLTIEVALEVTGGGAAAVSLLG